MTLINETTSIGNDSNTCKQSDTAVIKNEVLYVSIRSAHHLS